MRLAQRGVQLEFRRADRTGRLTVDSGAAVLTAGDNLAFELKQQLGLRATTDYLFNSHGYQEKWLKASNKQKYFILPTGDLYRYNGQPGDLSPDFGWYVIGVRQVLQRPTRQ